VARGSLTKRAGARGVYWRLQVRDSSGAVREERLPWKDKSGRIITSRGRAQERLNELVGELQGPAPAHVGRNKRRVRFVEVAAEWLATHPNAWTRREYESLLKSRILPTLGDVPVVDVTKVRLQQFIQESTGAPETLRKCLLIIRSVLEHAIDRNLIGRNPARGLKRPKVERPTLRVWSPAQVALFLNAFPPELFRWRVFCEVLFLAGLRFGEAVALTPAQVKAEILIVNRAWNAVRHVLKTPKSGRERSVDMSPQLQRDLLAYVERSGAAHDALLFPAPRGGYVGSSWFARRVWRPAVKRAALPAIRVHDARHTYVANLLEARENPVYVKEQAGHASAAFTLDRYGHLIPSRRRRRSLRPSRPAQKRRTEH
jgi:integrase